MPFAPQHNYEAYDAAVPNRLLSRSELSIEQKFLRYADFYNTLLQDRKQLVGSSESQLDQKRTKILAHGRLMTICRSLDKMSCKRR